MIFNGPNLDRIIYGNWTASDATPTGHFPVNWARRANGHTPNAEWGMESVESRMGGYSRIGFSPRREIK